MVRRMVTLALLFLTCVYAAPVPDNAKISLVRNSSFGLAFAHGHSKTAGILQGNNNVADVVKDLGTRPDFALLENINSGAGFAFDGSISVGVIKDNIFAGKNPFGRRK